MREANSWGLIGPGNIGQEVRRQLAQSEVAGRMGLGTLPSFVLSRAGVIVPNRSGAPNTIRYNGIEELLSLPDVTFIALPSTDDGDLAREYISYILGQGRAVVTAEKGALANFFSELQAESDNFARLGINATVGGGTKLMEVARTQLRDKGNIKQIHMVLNGTLTSVFSSIAPPGGAGGMSLGQAVDQATMLGYAEPGSTSPYEVIRLEAEGDIPKKTAILFNRLGLSSQVLDWRSLNINLTNENIAQAVEEARIRRFIISIYPEDYAKKISAPENDIIDGFKVNHEGWLIVGGFRHVDRNPLFSRLASLTGPANGIVIGLGPDETDGVYTFDGPGAGTHPTANVMIDDSLAVRESLNHG